jgi:hypothetical protein
MHTRYTTTMYHCQDKSPLCLLCGQELIQHVDNLLQTTQPLIELFLDSLLIIAKFAVKVLAVRSCAHGSTEDGLDHEAVVLAECVAVGRAERHAKLFGAVAVVLAERLRSKVEATMNQLLGQVAAC